MKLFNDEWVTEIFYGDKWHLIKKGTYQEFTTIKQELIRYTDHYSGNAVIIMDIVEGWQFEIPDPDENEITTNQLALELNYSEPTEDSSNG